MAINLLDMLKNTAGSALIKQASGFLGESEGKTESAVNAIFPALMGSIMQKGATKSGAEGLLGMLKDGNHDGSIFDNLGGLFGGGKSTDGLLNSGTSILSGLLGNKLGGIVDLIAGAAGIKNGIAGSLLKMAAPLVMSAIGKQVFSKGLGVSGLMDLLKGQKDYVSKAAPAGLGSLLGFADLGDGAKKVVAAAGNAGKKVTGAASSAASATVDAGRSGISKLLPFLGIGLLALAGLLGWKMCGSDIKDAAGDATELVGDAAGAVADGAKDAAGAVADGAKDMANAAADAVSSISLPSGADIKFAAGSFTDKLTKFLGGGEGDMNSAFTFDNVNFATGSAELTPESMSQINNLGEVLKAYKNVEIRVEGHTDNTGDAAANKSLSLKRALSVKEALTKYGIGDGRVAIAGYGSEKPVADNGTEAGRLANRRVDVYVTKK